MRIHFGIQSFGVNAYTATQEGESVGEHDEVEHSGTKHEELYYVSKGSATFTVDGETKTTSFPNVDQFAPQLLHFATCIQNDTEPEPCGQEGLADVRILEAVAESARTASPRRWYGRSCPALA